MNCKLYEKECKQSGISKSFSFARQQSTDDASANTVQNGISKQNVASNAPAISMDSSYFLNPEMASTGMQERPDVTACSFANFESPFTPTSQPTASAEDRSQQALQLDGLFENEILRSNVPFHDVSFLGDLVNEASNHLHSEPFIEERANPPSMSEQSATPYSKPTPISPYNPPKNRLSGIDSLHPTSGTDKSENHIPPGLFIGIDEGKIGFLG